jgi:hypothetical protein
MLYGLTNFRSTVIKLFYANPQINLISAETHQAVLTHNLINPARVINKTKELATSTRATRLVVEIPFYRHKENLKVFSTKKEEANLQLLL